MTVSLNPNKEYLIPKCEVHGTRTKVCVSTSKRYPQTLGFYCTKCNDELLEKISSYGP
jgi:hypothetical protein